MARNRKPAAQAATPMAATAGDILLASLRNHGLEYFFANPGTDFPAIVEGFARAKLTGAKVPRSVLVPHENLAVAMAHGAYLITGMPQAVMVHVNVGTANTINLLANAARDRVPLLLMAGRSPIMEAGAFGARSRPIHWAQEMFDQAGMVREFVKWDYELRNPAQAGLVVTRAIEVAMAEPRGPVYLTLPREAVSAPTDAKPTEPRCVPSSAHPDPALIARLADWLMKSERPLLIASSLGRMADETITLSRNRRAICAAGGGPHAALSLSADRPSPASRVRSPSIPRRRGPHPHYRGRRALDAERQSAAANCARRAYRRGSGISALSHALVPQPSLDSCEHRRRAACARDRTEEVDRQATRRKTRSGGDGRYNAPRRSGTRLTHASRPTPRTFRRSISADASGRWPVATVSSSTNIS